MNIRIAARRFLSRLLSIALSGLFFPPPPLTAAALLQIRVVEGEGMVYAAGARATHGVSVQVTDETGRPVEGATVSFQLPKDGPGGTFEGGLSTQIATTRADGTASVWGMQWNRSAGPFELRILASKGQARAGIVCRQYLKEKSAAGAGAGGTGTFERSRNWHAKWLLAGLAIGGGVLGSLAIVGRRTAGAPGVVAQPPPSVGTPTISIGHP